MGVILVEIGGVTAGAVGIRDQLRPEAAEAVAALRAQGVAVLMLTGDNRRTAEALARAADIDGVPSNCRRTRPPRWWRLTQRRQTR